jgi:pilus assembly protein CpaF
VVRLEARPANAEGVGQVRVRELVRNALRMRPDRLLVGEARGPEAFDLLQAMNTGHDGSLSTCHANSPPDALRRLETMVLMAEVALPLAAVRQQIGAAVDVVVQVARRPGGARAVVQVAEVGDRPPAVRVLAEGGVVVGAPARPPRSS